MATSFLLILREHSQVEPTHQSFSVTFIFLKESITFFHGCESWTVKKAECLKIDAFELWCWRRLLKVPWTGKEIQPVHPKRDQSWVFFGKNDAAAETPVLWPPHAKS